MFEVIRVSTVLYYQESYMDNGYVFSLLSRITLTNLTWVFNWVRCNALKDENQIVHIRQWGLKQTENKRCVQKRMNNLLYVYTALIQHAPLLKACWSHNAEFDSAKLTQNCLLSIFNKTNMCMNLALEAFLNVAFNWMNWYQVMHWWIDNALVLSSHYFIIY